MRSTRRLVTAALCAAGAVVILLVGWISPTGQPGFAAVASLFVAAASIECGFAWGIASYFVSSAIAFGIIGTTPIFWLYLLFLGYYPVLRLAVERLPVVPGLICKLFVFCAALFGLTRIINIADMLKFMAKSSIMWWLGIAALIIVFIVYDIGYGKLIVFYKTRIRVRRR